MNKPQSPDDVLRSRLKQLVTEREIKLGRRIKQEEIAEATGLNPNTISRWMSPKPFDRVESRALEALCRWLKCSPGELLYFDARHKSP